MLVVTTDLLPGYVIRHVLGEVHGVTARPRNKFAEGVTQLSGGLDPYMPTKLAHSRDEAIAGMTRQAYRRGGNAVVAMRFDHRDVSDSWTEICAYGTAVFAVPAAGRVPPQREAGHDRAGGAGQADGAEQAAPVRPRQDSR
jgi:uncharacterized protein YbjQ (UPF0145 family)